MYSETDHIAHILFAFVRSAYFSWFFAKYVLLVIRVDIDVHNCKLAQLFRIANGLKRTSPISVGIDVNNFKNRNIFFTTTEIILELHINRYGRSTATYFSTFSGRSNEWLELLDCKCIWVQCFHTPWRVWLASRQYRPLIKREISQIISLIVTRIGGEERDWIRDLPYILALSRANTYTCNCTYCCEYHAILISSRLNIF